MKKAIFMLYVLLLLVMSTVFSYGSNNEVEEIINKYVNYIKTNKWDEYVELFNYDSEVREDLLHFLKDSKKQSEKEGIHTIKDIQLVNIELSSDLEFISKGDYVYDVLLDMQVYKTSEFYMNGVTRHVFVFNRTSAGLKIETIYLKGLVDKNSVKKGNIVDKESRSHNWLRALLEQKKYKVGASLFLLISITLLSFIICNYYNNR